MAVHGPSCGLHLMLQARFDMGTQFTHCRGDGQGHDKGPNPTHRQVLDASG